MIGEWVEDERGRKKWKTHVRVHDLRHVAASAWIAAGADPVFVSRQLGHADPAITMRIYAGEFDRVRHADRVRAALEDASPRSDSCGLA